jgi:hypothetical protein
MSKHTRFVAPLIAVAMMTVPMMAPAQSSQKGNATTSSTASPGSEQEQSQAFRDGVESATIDMAAKRVLDPQKSFRYSHPPVKKGAEREAYLAGFSAGYQAQVKKAAQPGV